MVVACKRPSDEKLPFSFDSGAFCSLNKLFSSHGADKSGKIDLDELKCWKSKNSELQENISSSNLIENLEPID
jgi:hypothetical protein